MSSSRERLITSVGPALTYLQARANLLELASIDLDLSTRLWIERLSGERDDGAGALLASSTLWEGTAPSVPRLREMRQTLRDVLTEIRDNPDAFGVVVVEREGTG